MLRAALSSFGVGQDVLGSGALSGNRSRGGVCGFASESQIVFRHSLLAKLRVPIASPFLLCIIDPLLTCLHV